MSPRRNDDSEEERGGGALAWLDRALKLVELPKGHALQQLLSTRWGKTAFILGCSVFFVGTVVGGWSLYRLVAGESWAALDAARSGGSGGSPSFKDPGPAPHSSLDLVRGLKWAEPPADEPDPSASLREGRGSAAEGRSKGADSSLFAKLSNLFKKSLGKEDSSGGGPSFITGDAGAGTEARQAGRLPNLRDGSEPISTRPRARAKPSVALGRSGSSRNFPDSSGLLARRAAGAQRTPSELASRYGSSGFQTAPAGTGALSPIGAGIAATPYGGSGVLRDTTAGSGGASTPGSGVSGGGGTGGTGEDSSGRGSDSSGSSEADRAKQEADRASREADRSEAAANLAAGGGRYIPPQARNMDGSGAGGYRCVPAFTGGGSGSGRAQTSDGASRQLQNCLAAKGDPEACANQYLSASGAGSSAGSSAVSANPCPPGSVPVWGDGGYGGSYYDDPYGYPLDGGPFEAGEDVTPWGEEQKGIEEKLNWAGYALMAAGALAIAYYAGLATVVGAAGAQAIRIAIMVLGGSAVALSAASGYESWKVWQKYGQAKQGATNIAASGVTAFFGADTIRRAAHMTPGVDVHTAFVAGWKNVVAKAFLPNFFRMEGYALLAGAVPAAAGGFFDEQGGGLEGAFRGAVDGAVGTMLNPQTHVLSALFAFGGALGQARGPVDAKLGVPGPATEAQPGVQPKPGTGLPPSRSNPGALGTGQKFYVDSHGVPRYLNNRPVQGPAFQEAAGSLPPSQVTHVPYKGHDYYVGWGESGKPAYFTAQGRPVRPGTKTHADLAGYADSFRPAWDPALSNNTGGWRGPASGRAVEAPALNYKGRTYQLSRVQDGKPVFVTEAGHVVGPGTKTYADLLGLAGQRGIGSEPAARPASKSETGSKQPAQPHAHETSPKPLDLQAPIKPTLRGRLSNFGTKAGRNFSDGLRGFEVALREGRYGLQHGIQKTPTTVAKAPGAVRAGAEKVADGARHVGGQIKEGAVHTGQKVALGARRVGHEVKEFPGKAGHAVRTGAEKVADGARQTGGRIKEGAVHTGERIASGARRVGQEIKQVPAKTAAAARKAGGKIQEPFKDIPQKEAKWKTHKEARLARDQQKAQQIKERRAQEDALRAAQQELPPDQGIPFDALDSHPTLFRVQKGGVTREFFAKDGKVVPKGTPGAERWVQFKDSKGGWGQMRGPSSKPSLPLKPGDKFTQEVDGIKITKTVDPQGTPKYALPDGKPAEPKQVAKFEKTHSGLTGKRLKHVGRVAVGAVAVGIAKGIQNLPDGMDTLHRGILHGEAVQWIAEGVDKAGRKFRQGIDETGRWVVQSADAAGKWGHEMILHGGAVRWIQGGVDEAGRVFRVGIDEAGLAVRQFTDASGRWFEEQILEGGLVRTVEEGVAEAARQAHAAIHAAGGAVHEAAHAGGSRPHRHEEGRIIFLDEVDAEAAP